MNNTARTKVSKVIVKIVNSIKDTLLSKSVDESLVVASFQALNAITVSMCPGEESSLTTLVPVTMTYVREGRSVLAALNATSSLVNKLGPRVIPYFKEIVSVSVGVFSSSGL